MNSVRTVFAQLLGFVPFAHFEHLVDKYQANRWTRDFTVWSHFIYMAYAQLTRREGLRDLVACLNSQSSKHYPVGLRNRVTRSTLADANERRSSELFESLAQRLIELAIAQHKNYDIGIGLKQPLYAMDSTTIDLCLKLFPWANFRSTKAAVKAHTVIDLRGAIPVMITITTGKVHDVKALDSLQLPAGSIVVLDRGYVAFARLYALVQRQCSFVVKAKGNMKFATMNSHAFDPSTGIRADQTIQLLTHKSPKACPSALRRVEFFDEKTQLDLVFLINRPDLPAPTIAAIYKQRWQIELFFKWLKQNLPDTSGNLYTSDNFHELSSVRKINLTTRTVSTLAGNSELLKSGGKGHADGVGANARFYGIAGIALDTSGNLFIADTANKAIRKVSTNGETTTFAGKGPNSVGDADGVGVQAIFGSAYAIAIDTSGNLFVADYVSNKIKRITPYGVVTTIAGSGAWDSIDGVGANAAFKSISGITLDSKGNIYVSDVEAINIRKLTPN